MELVADCGFNVTQIVHDINCKNKNKINLKKNYTYEGWSIFHCAASMGDEKVLRSLIVFSGDSIDIEASNPWYENERTPRSILVYKHPHLLLKFEQEGII